MKTICFGVDLGGTTVKMGIFDKEQGLLDKWEIVTRKEQRGSLILDDIAASIKEKIEERNIVHNAVIGIGIGVPGPVTADGVVHTCVNLGWEVVEVKKELSEKTGFDVAVANDANVAALGELWMGGGKGYRDLVMVTLGTGVGGGIILGGRILPGIHGGAGEIGHMPVVYDEEEYCNCGKTGCLEQVASATGIVKEAKKILNSSTRESVLRKEESITAKAVFDAAKAGDVLALEVANRLGEYLGIALAHVASVIDPEVFVIGGGVSKAGEVLIELTQKYYKEKVFPGAKDAAFALAKLGNDAGIYGAAKMML